MHNKSNQLLSLFDFLKNCIESNIQDSEHYKKLKEIAHPNTVPSEVKDWPNKFVDGRNKAVLEFIKNC